MPERTLIKKKDNQKKKGDTCDGRSAMGAEWPSLFCDERPIYNFYGLGLFRSLVSITYEASEFNFLEFQVFQISWNWGYKYPL